jgi:hypothetical protein
MGALSTREVAAKAAGDLTPTNLSASGGYLPVDQADRFIDLMQEEPTLLKDVQVVKMNSPIKQLDLAGFSSRILHASTTGTKFDSDSRSKLDLGKATLTSKKWRAVVRLGYDTVEDCIERGVLKQTVQTHMLTRASLDLEEFVVLGDTESEDTDLAQMDGIIAQCETNIIDNTGDPQEIAAEIYLHGLMALPQRYKRDKANTRFYQSPTVSEIYRDVIAQRTTQVGDAHLMGQPGGLNYQGYSLYDVSWMPDNSYILTHRNNIVVGIQRQMLLKVDEDIEAEEWVFVLSLRADCVYQEEAGVVLYKGIEIPAVATT